MSASDPRPPIPAGYSPPFSTVTDDNHAAWLIIATALGLACILIFVSARVVVRFSVSSSVGTDDWVLASAVVSRRVESFDHVETDIGTSGHDHSSVCRRPRRLFCRLG